MTCRELTAAGEPCQTPDHLVGENGLCVHHDPLRAEQRREAALKGGAANAAKLASPGFNAADLPPITTNAEAKTALDAIRVAILTRQITHAEGGAAARAIDTWLKADAATITHGLVNELRRELDVKAKEIESLRKQLAERGRNLRAS